jgi:hypothetical protein
LGGESETLEGRGKEEEKEDRGKAVGGTFTATAEETVTEGGGDGVYAEEAAKEGAEEEGRGSRGFSGARRASYDENVSG